MPLGYIQSWSSQPEAHRFINIIVFRRRGAAERRGLAEKRERESSPSLVVHSFPLCEASAFCGAAAVKGAR
jgi:hypothetical protein